MTGHSMLNEDVIGSSLRPYIKPLDVLHLKPRLSQAEQLQITSS